MPDEEMLKLPKNVWTITKKWKAGDIAAASYHKVEILEILEERATCNLARVKVLEPIKGALGQRTNERTGEIIYTPIPDLTFHGEVYGPEQW